MSDYEDDDDLSYEYESEEEFDDDVDDINAENNFETADPNGHREVEQDEDERKGEEELYGDEEPVETEDPLKEEDEEEEPEIEEPEPEEVKTVKKEANIIPIDKRKTSKVMTKFEYSYLVSQRAMAIENGSPLMFPDTKFIHAIDIAREETMLGANPIIIQRIIPSHPIDLIEEWKCNELIVPFAYYEEENFLNNFF